MRGENYGGDNETLELGPLRVTLAKTAGFCFGVNRAVEAARKIAERGENAVTLGRLIHNSFVTDELKSKGIGEIASPSEAGAGSTVIIRAHGVGRSEFEELKKAGVKIYDATCPFVKRIHNIVSENSSLEVPVLIAGDPEHPEVKGVKGYCKGDVFIFSNSKELEKIIASNESLRQNRIIIVAQTTFSQKEWKKCKEKIKIYCTNAKIFDTICFATQKRQDEAEKLSQKSDLMLVIGERGSSNAAKLKAVCEENCETYLTERADELKNIDFSKRAEVGVTAGASTPAAIIKEVLFKMSEIVKETENNQVEEAPSEAAKTGDEINFSEALEASLSSMSTDQKVKGIVISVTPTEIQVDVGRKHAGFVPLDEYSSDPAADPAKEVKPGDELNLIIMKTNDAEGTVMLSKKRYDAQKAWLDIVEANEDGKILEGTVSNVVKGGVIVFTNGVRVFIPASQAAERRNEPLDALVGKKVQFRIIEADKRRKRAVGSIRSVLQDLRREAAEAFWASAKVGDKHTGIVKSMTNYGAFVDIGGVDGMVHISEMSWNRIKNPSEAFEIGQEVEVYIKALDDENRKISLGYKKAEDNPWEILRKKYPEGSVVETEIVGLTDFGAFARVIPGIDGLIHISQIADRRINNPKEVLSIGDKTTCKITAIDFEKKRVSLSIRALIESPEGAEIKKAPAEEAPAEEAPAEEAPAEEAPAEEAPAEEAPAEEAPAEEAPAEEAPAEEAPAEEAPAEEAPAEGAPAEEASAEGAPAEEAPSTAVEEETAE